MITISTCGTSILTNGVEQKISNILRMNTNLKENEINSDDKAVIDKIIELKKNILLNSNIQQARNISAEINGLFGICNEDLNVLKSNGSFHYLICTDTYQGKSCANIIKEYLQKCGINCIVLTISDLRADNTSNAHNGLSELTRRINEITEKPNGKIIFNLVGGFKLLQGFMQTLGMFYADEIFYLFEGKKEPIKIPKLLVKFDYSDIIIESLRRISFELEPLQGADLGVLILDGAPIILSEWGELVWPQVKKSYYLKLRDPLLPTVSYSDGFKRDFDKLSNNDKVELHEHIDYVSKHLFTKDKRWNMNSVRFHSLEGLSNGMTHEFYCFTGRDDRVYGKFENNIFHIECIWRHL
jgi:putative CRISPR-associated protein (TIGR02619 family)